MGSSWEYSITVPLEVGKSSFGGQHVDMLGMNLLKIGYDRAMNQDCQFSAVVLAGGKGTRMHPLTLHSPKPLQEVLGRSLLRWKLDFLPEAITDIVLVVGHQGDQIRAHIGDEYAGRQVRYVTQGEQRGTMHALSLTLPLHLSRMLVMMGDDLYAKEDMERMLAYEHAMLVCEREGSVRGSVEIDADGRVLAIREDEVPMERAWVNTGMYMLTPSVYHVPPVAINAQEVGLPQSLLAPGARLRIDACKATRWMQVSTPEDLLRAGEWLMS
jgi:NDP-sugar pyrophosphorylase family protein